MENILWEKGIVSCATGLLNTTTVSFSVREQELNIEHYALNSSVLIAQMEISTCSLLVVTAKHIKEA